MGHPNLQPTYKSTVGHGIFYPLDFQLTVTALIGELYNLVMLKRKALPVGNVGQNATGL